MQVTIRTRLISGYVILASILLIVASINLYSRHVLLEGLEEMEEVAEEIELTQRLSLAIEKALMPPNDYLITGGKAERSKFQSALAETYEILGRLEGHEIVTEEEKKLLKELREKLSGIRIKAEEIFSLPPAKGSKGAEIMYSMDGLAREAHTVLDAYADIDRRELRETKERSLRLTMHVDRSMLLGAALVIGLGIAFVLYMERAIRRPINSLLLSIKKLADGKWEHVEIRNGLEITTLAVEYNRMVEMLKSAYEGLEAKVAERTRELNELNKWLEKLSITDGLTGVHNHRYFYIKLGEEITRAARYGHPLSLIILDVDYFKHYNDTHGHLAGDNILKGIASCIKSSVRDNDLVARYGGEEFSVILPEADKDAAEGLAERLRKFISEQPFPHKETQPGGNLTISLGLAAYPADAGDVKGLVEKADAALYRAKEGGRNRVEAA